MDAWESMIEMVFVGGDEGRGRPGLRGLDTGTSRANDNDPLVGGIVYCWFVMISNIITILGILFILRRMKIKRRLAQAGETAAKHSVILPAYEHLLWILDALFFVAAVLNALVLWSYNDPYYKTKRNEFMHLQIQSVVFLSFYSIVPVLLCQRTVTTKAFHTTFLIVAPWLLFNIVMAVLLIQSYQCDPNARGGEEDEGETNDDGLSQDKVDLPCIDMPLEFPKGGELVFALSGPLPAFIFHFLCVTGKFKTRIELRSRNAKLSTFFACIYSVIVLVINLFGFLCTKVENVFIHLMQVGSISLLVMNLIFPFAIYKSLIADTKYWRGLGRYNKGIGPQAMDKTDAGGEIGPVSISVASTNMQNMMNSHILVDFSYLKVGKKIGKGSTATVYMGEFKKQQVAIKVFLPPEITEEDVNSFSQEANMAAGLIHKNIVKTIGICVRPPSIALVTEYCEHGNLLDFMRHPDIAKHANLLWRFRCAIDAVAAVQYLHSCHILHRDIKADNYFLDADGVVKLGDFGESTIYVNPKTGGRHNTISSAGSGKKMTIVGTVSNMAPEMINAQRKYTEAVDIYSLGVTLWEIWTAETPFKNFNQFQVYQMVGEKRVRPDFPDEMNQVYRQCVGTAWSQSPFARPSAKVLLKALCTEHDRINKLMNKVGAKMKRKLRESRESGKSSEDERKGGDKFNTDNDTQENFPTSLLPLAFKMKSESDNSTLSDSMSDRRSKPVIRGNIKNLGISGKVGKTVRFRPGSGSDADTMGSDLTEDEDLESIIYSQRDSATVSLRDYEKELSEKTGLGVSTSVANPVNGSKDSRKSRKIRRISTMNISRLVSSVLNLDEKTDKPGKKRNKSVWSRGSGGSGGNGGNRGSGGNRCSWAEFDEHDDFRTDESAKKQADANSLEAAALQRKTSTLEEEAGKVESKKEEERRGPVSMPETSDIKAIAEAVEVELTGVAGSTAVGGSQDMV